MRQQQEKAFAAKLGGHLDVSYRVSSRLPITSVLRYQCSVLRDRDPLELGWM